MERLSNNWGHYEVPSGAAHPQTEVVKLQHAEAMQAMDEVSAANGEATIPVVMDNSLCDEATHPGALVYEGSAADLEGDKFIGSSPNPADRLSDSAIAQAPRVELGGREVANMGGFGTIVVPEGWGKELR